VGLMPPADLVRDAWIVFADATKMVQVRASGMVVEGRRVMEGAELARSWTF